MDGVEGIQGYKVSDSLVFKAMIWFAKGKINDIKTIKNLPNSN